MIRILIASNDIILLNTISIFMKMDEYNVEICSEPKNIYQKVLEFNPSIVFFDDDLTVENSKSLCNKIKNDPKTSHIRVIIYSKTTGKIKSFSDCKPDDYFYQPFSLSDLVKKISKQASLVKSANLQPA